VRLARYWTAIRAIPTKYCNWDSPLGPMVRMRKIRRPAAPQSGLDTIAAFKQELPELIVGAGSLLTPDMGDAAIQVGARFLVGPGTNVALLQFAVKCGVPFLPGAATVSEIMRVLDVGRTAARLFPAEVLGGITYLRSLAGPISSMKFCPTGSVDMRGSRRATCSCPTCWRWVRENRFDDIHRLAAQAAAS